MIRGKRQIINEFNLTEEEYERYYEISKTRSDYNMEDIIQFAREWEKITKELRCKLKYE